MVSADDQAKGFDEQCLGLDLGRTRLGESDAQIEGVLGQCRLDAVLGHLLHAQGHAGIAGAEAFDQRADEVGGERGRHRQPERSTAQILHVVDGPGSGVKLPQGAAGIAQVGFAGVCQPHGPPGPVQELDVQRVLQLLDLLRQRRLGDMQCFGRAGEVLVFRDRGQVADVA